MTCDKCKSPVEHPAKLYAWGKVTNLCPKCHDFLNDHPTIDVQTFLKDKTKIGKAIYDAYQERREGKSKWEHSNKVPNEMVE